MSSQPSSPDEPATDILREEIACFERRLPELLDAHGGRWALVKGSRLDLYDTNLAALEAGYQRFGVAPFLVRAIIKEERIVAVTRLLY